MYAIIDIETTGGNPKTDKITEIAVLLHNGNTVVSEFNTLINPECRIPYHISALTGISNEMVANAPKFYEVARELVEITENAVFVAHNVAFDYGFIRNEFRRLGFEYTREQLCTVRLSRKLIPGHRSYSLGRLCDELRIPVNGRHRAMGDARATSMLFDILLRTESESKTAYISNTIGIPRDLHPCLDANLFKKLPEEAGVYYFYNKDLELIYIGKSRNIKRRVLSHFSNSTTAKALQMRSQIADVSYEITGNELIALLRESHEIKKFKPLFNRAQRRALFRYELIAHTNENGYFCFSLVKTGETDIQPRVCFTSKAEALGFINTIIDKYGLCQKLCGIYPSLHHCFHYEIGACKGACIGKESPASYNIRAEKVMDKYYFGFQNLLIVDSGRNNEERGVVKIENGKYLGFGYFSTLYAALDERILHDCIQDFPDNREVQQIIRQYLRNNRVDKLIVF
jgi:DNA polymerase III subunit epsilon